MILGIKINIRPYKFLGFLLSSIVFAALVCMSQKAFSKSEKLQAAHALVDAAVAVADKNPGKPQRPGCMRGYDVTTSNGIVIQAGLLREIGGFAQMAGTTGGLNGRLYIVTSDRDYDPKAGRPIPGTLRQAIDFLSHRDLPGWIVFDHTIAGGVIELKSALRLGDNVTVDGTCSSVSLVSEASKPLIIVKDKKNVIIAGISMRKHPYSGENKQRDDGRDFRDCITVSGSVDALAILHNNFRECGDGEIDITSGIGKPMPRAGGRITLAFNRFEKHDKAILIGTDGCRDRSSNLADGCPRMREGQTALSPLYNLSLQGNLFLWTGQRNPRIFGRVYAHLLNNVFAFEPYDRGNGTSGATYGQYVSNSAAVRAENNIYVGSPEKAAPLGLFTASTPGAFSSEGDLDGEILATGNLQFGNEVIAQNGPSVVAHFRGDGLGSQEIPVQKLGLSGAITCVASRAGVLGSAYWLSSFCGNRS